MRRCSCLNGRLELSLRRAQTCLPHDEGASPDQFHAVDDNFAAGEGIEEQVEGADIG